ncbi:hypothetical protein F3H86_01365 [Aeromonas veronii]|nr:hypothetical protein [Aeromonas veronii]MBE8738322.1 hypothetical protein [Aeromonas veronii]MBE8741917.1 hypothetical protein [Aeromonas veronii]MBE8763267.1 hypothetical protein [Aeromonas veronii]MBE8837879.1 hypothetical protein [Aeromonas veronii]
MKPLLLLALLSIGFAASAKEQVPDARLVDEQVKQQIIQESIDSYPGNCPCPYNLARNGSRCGKRSAWSRAGGYAPICYKEEITDEMVSEWRGRADN